jgi:predicted MFS family arabinose efflux permease
MSAQSRRYSWYILGLLTLINFFNYTDRQVIVSMYDAFRQRFGMGNFEIGALTTAFYVVHAVTTIPFGWAADHWDRRRILAFGVIFWSLATLGSAWAVGFWSLFLLRGAIGVGEAAYLPVSNAVLCEVFPQKDKARTIGIFNGGMFVGGCAGIMVGSWLGFPSAFQVVAIPGLILGVLALNLRISRRRVMDRSQSETNWRVLLASGWKALNSKTAHWMLAGGILISCTATSFITWFVDFVIHYHFVGVPEEEAKTAATRIFGIIAITGGSLGVIVGGWVADHLRTWWRSGRALTIALGFLLAIPCAMGAVFLDRGWPFYIASWLMMFFVPWYNGPIAALIDDVVDDDQAATAQASVSFMLHLCGSGPAAFLVGGLSAYVGLRWALMLPTATMLLSALCFLMAARHVGRDMDARTARARVLLEARKAA